MHWSFSTAQLLPLRISERDLWPDLWAHYLQDQKLCILVATSGDTGSAVAQGFYEVPGIEVVILYILRQSQQNPGAATNYCRS